MQLLDSILFAHFQLEFEDFLNYLHFQILLWIYKSCMHFYKRNMNIQFIEDLRLSEYIVSVHSFCICLQFFFFLVIASLDWFAISFINQLVCVCLAEQQIWMNGLLQINCSPPRRMSMLHTQKSLEFCWLFYIFVPAERVWRWDYEMGCICMHVWMDVRKMSTFFNWL